MSARGVILHVCSGCGVSFSVCSLFRCGYMRRAFAILARCWLLLVSPSCRCFSGSPTSLLFRWVSLLLLPFLLVVSIPSWFYDSIGSTVSLATGSPFGSSRYRLALAQPRCLGLIRGILVSLLLGFARLSITPRPVSLVSFPCSLSL